jgi:hypothetical protein
MLRSTQQTAETAAVAVVPRGAAAEASVEIGSQAAAVVALVSLSYQHSTTEFL